MQIWWPLKVLSHKQKKSKFTKAKGSLWTELKQLKSCTQPGTAEQCRLLYNTCDVKRHHSFKLLNSSKTRLFVLYSQNYAAGHYRFFNTTQKPLLKSSYPKKYLPKFSYPIKSRNRKFETQKILLSSPSLEIPSTPWGPGSFSGRTPRKPDSRERRELNLARELFWEISAQSRDIVNSQGLIFSK